jgi:hypothetical protein
MSESDRCRLEERLERELRKLDFRSLGNEPNYNPALVQVLKGFEYTGANFSLSIGGAPTDSYTAEKPTGADMAIYADIRSGADLKQKAVLIQAKRISRWRKPAEYSRLLDQIREMKRFTPHPKVLLIDDKKGGLPIIKSAAGILSGDATQDITLSSWLARRFVRTFDGDLNPTIYEAAHSPELDRIWLKAEFF